ncbi:MAG: S8 family serine peptidase [Dehalococcoidia bacterium]|nr:S8 family serine peptidase [Dehalococcoidia bacterium]
MQYATRAFLLAILAWLILAFSPSVLFTAPPGIEGIDRTYLRKIEPQLLKELLAAKDGRVRFIVQFAGSPDLSAAAKVADKSTRRRVVAEALMSTATRSQKAALASLEQLKQRGNVDNYSSLWIVNGAAVLGNRESLFAMAGRPEVLAIRADQVRHLDLPAETTGEPVTAVADDGLAGANTGQPLGLEWNIAKIRADAVWLALSITGTGVVVASLDTGVDWQHPALTDKYRGNSGRGIVNHAGNWFDFTTDAFQYPIDGYGHGTHVTGIMVGSDSTNRLGVAPGAKWIAAKVFLRDGSSLDSWIHTAFQWILQPDGDPDLAPDIVNCSWGSPDGADLTFEADIDALLAAGITPVFAAGNSGSGAGSVFSPASLNNAFSVGATDSADNIANFSSRGPSPFGMIKPEVSAPGVSIRSTYPGGSYVLMSGTSMATPHVAGVLALLKQANPSLTPIQALSLITSTALPLGTGRPNNSYGWGRVDAYAAVSLAMQAGSISGVVRRPGGIPVAGAVVTATNENTATQAVATSGQDGYYAMDLAFGSYDVRAGAFGYVESAPVRVAILSGRAVTQDIALIPLPVGFITGLVAEEGTGQPLTATVTIAGTPLSAQTDPSTGSFTLTAPAGTYDVRAASPRHRFQTQTGVPVVVSATTSLTFSLTSAPSILLVDSGAWYAQSKISYFSSALDQLDYLYSVRSITDTRLFPNLVELSPYDIVIWSSPLDSPGYIGADTALAGYLDGGGKLLLTGQDIGYYDGGGTALGIDAPYFRTHLQARLVSDDSGISNLVGVTGTLFAGITLTLNTVDSARNQQYPDTIAPEGTRSSQVVDYGRDGGVGGIETDVCLPYRLIYLGFGLEGAGPAANRLSLLQKSVDWLASQPPSREVRVLPASQRLIREQGKVATTTLTIWNTGTLSDSLTATTSGGDWPITIWDETFSIPLTTTGQIFSCQAITTGVRIEVPPGTGKNVSNVAAVSLVSQIDPTLRVTGTVAVKTPAFVLLVDDDRWYDVESSYKNALFDLGYPYDVYNTAGGPGPGISTLSLYSITVWFTGYDWYQPLTAQDESNLAAYLDGDGRLFLSSQDYLFVRGFDDFEVNYLGILTYTNDITAVQVSGAVGDMVGDGLGPYSLTMPYPGFREWSDEVTPRPLASASFLNIHGVPTGLENLDGAGRGRTVFYSFPFEGLAPEAGKAVMDRIVGRALSTDLKVDKAGARVGDELRYEGSIFNPGIVTASWTITAPVPAATTIVPGSLTGGATFDAGVNRILWSGQVAPGETRWFSYKVEVEAGATVSIANSVIFDNQGKGSFRRTATTSRIFDYRYYFPLIRSG